jgi:hypothetical protein
MGLPDMLSLFNEGAPVTRYSPAVFDAFVNQTKVSSPSGYFNLLTWMGIMNVFPALGGAPLCSGQECDPELGP